MKGGSQAEGRLPGEGAGFVCSVHSGGKNPATGTRGQLRAEGGWTVLDVGGKSKERGRRGVRRGGAGESGQPQMPEVGLAAEGFKSPAPSVLSALTAPHPHPEPSSRPLSATAQCWGCSGDPGVFRVWAGDRQGGARGGWGLDSQGSRQPPGPKSEAEARRRQTIPAPKAGDNREAEDHIRALDMFCTARGVGEKNKKPKLPPARVSRWRHRQRSPDFWLPGTAHSQGFTMETPT